MNMAVFVPRKDYPIDDSDPVGRRGVNLPPINIEIAHISNTGRVRVAFDPPIPREILGKIVLQDIVLSIRAGTDRASAKDQLAFTYSYTHLHEDYLDI